MTSFTSFKENVFAEWKQIRGSCFSIRIQKGWKEDGLVVVFTIGYGAMRPVEGIILDFFYWGYYNKNIFVSCVCYARYSIHLTSMSLPLFVLCDRRVMFCIGVSSSSVSNGCEECVKYGKFLKQEAFLITSFDYCPKCRPPLPLFIQLFRLFGCHRNMW